MLNKTHNLKKILAIFGSETASLLFHLSVFSPMLTTDKERRVIMSLSLCAHTNTQECMQDNKHLQRAEVTSVKSPPSDKSEVFKYF